MDAHAVLYCPWSHIRFLAKITYNLSDAASNMGICKMALCQTKALCKDDLDEVKSRKIQYALSQNNYTLMLRSGEQTAVEISLKHSLRIVSFLEYQKACQVFWRIH